MLEYAQRTNRIKGKRDGLSWPVDPKTGESPSPFGPLVADAGPYLKGKDREDPFKGYYFKILACQNDNPPGGQYSYVINDNMIAGFALLVPGKTVFGVIPLLPDPFWNATAAAIMADLGLDAILTVIPYPTVCATLHGIKAPASGTAEAANS